METSNRNGGVALRTGGGDIHVKPLVEKHRHDDALMPAIERLCTDAGVRPADLDVIGVSVGPGGFTGVRIAVVTAKVLAEVLGCDLVEVPTAEVVAASVPVRTGDSTGNLAVCLSAKRDTVWVQRFAAEKGRWRSTRPGAVIRAADLLAEPTDLVAADEHLPEEAKAACRSAGTEIIEPRFDPVKCLELTLEKLALGETVTPLDLLPLYPREPEAVSKWRERKAGGSGGSGK